MPLKLCKRLRAASRLTRSHDPIALARLIGLHRLLQFLGRPEGNLLACLDLDGLARRRVATHSGRPLAHLEDPDPVKRILSPLPMLPWEVRRLFSIAPSPGAPLIRAPPFKSLDGRHRVQQCALEVFSRPRHRIVVGNHAIRQQPAVSRHHPHGKIFGMCRYGCGSQPRASGQRRAAPSRARSSLRPRPTWSARPAPPWPR